VIKGEYKVNYIGKILPVDGYYVSLKGELPVDYVISMTHLYQPLIGIQAVALYQTLLIELEFQSTAPQTHHTLMNYMNLPLDEIYQARLKLEGIGLLTTMRKKSESETFYMYELHRPFAPKEFFRDAMLTQLLYYHIGEQKFQALKKHYEKQESKDRGENITASFHDVFETFQPSLEVVKPIPEEESSRENEENMDFSWMKQALKQRMIPAGRILTLENRKLISQMKVLYDLTTYDVEKSVLWALTDDNLLDREEFKNACHDLFKSKNHGAEIKLTQKISIPKEQTKEIPMTKEEMLIQELETMSPKQLLEDLSNGNHASEQDLKAVREVMTTQGLPTPVMNVLIHYVLLQTNMKLSKGYLEKIASHWSRAKIKTAKEAMDFAKQEKARFENDKKRKASYRKPASKEVIPDWFEERKKQSQEQMPAQSQSYTLADLEREKAKLKKARKSAENSRTNRYQG